jgi:hypothetical protein
MIDIAFDPIWALKHGYTIVSEYENGAINEYKVIEGQLMSKSSFLLFDGDRTGDDCFRPCFHLKLGVNAKYSLVPAEASF